MAKRNFLRKLGQSFGGGLILKQYGLPFGHGLQRYKKSHVPLLFDKLECKGQETFGVRVK